MDQKTFPLHQYLYRGIKNSQKRARRSQFVPVVVRRNSRRTDVVQLMTAAGNTVLALPYEPTFARSIQDGTKAPRTTNPDLNIRIFSKHDCLVFSLQWPSGELDWREVTLKLCFGGEWGGPRFICPFSNFEENENVVQAFSRNPISQIFNFKEEICQGKGEPRANFLFFEKK
jgi:hypothetical protein